MQDRSIRVFISYSHDNPAHSDAVMKLAGRLREDGIDAWMDAYEVSPPQGWPQWMLKQVKDAQFVLLVCTKIYQERFEGASPTGKGLGVKFEGATVTQALYEDECQNRKFVPVILKSEDVTHRPVAIRPFTYFNLSTEEGYEQLYRLLTGQPAITPPRIGALKQLPSSSARGNTDATTPVHFTPRTVDTKRLRGEVAISTDLQGATLVLQLANLAAFPIFLDHPRLVLKQPKDTSAPVNLNDGSDEPSSAITLLPRRPSSGPLQPTEARQYFLPHQHVEFVRAEFDKLDRGHAYIAVSSGIGEELRLDSSNELNTIRAFLTRGSEKLNATDREADQASVRIAPDRMAMIIKLVHKRVTKQAKYPYKVFAPRSFLKNPAVATTSNAIELLRDEPFLVRFMDGTQEQLSFIELMVMTHQIIHIALTQEELSRRLSPTIPHAMVSVKSDLDVARVMEPESVKVLLEKLQFERISTEDALELKHGKKPVRKVRRKTGSAPKNRRK